MDGLAYWGLSDCPGGLRKEGGKEVGEKLPRGGIYKKMVRCQESA